MLFGGVLPSSLLYSLTLDLGPFFQTSSLCGLSQLGAAQSLAFAPLGGLLGLWALFLISQGSLQQGPGQGWGLLLGLGLLGVALPEPATSVPELWGAPLHVLAALTTFVAAMVGGLGRGGAYLSPLAVSLLVLGLLWNFLQNAFQLAWAWDWIEAVPGYLVLGSVFCAHFWGRFGGLGAALLFFGGLQFGRMALSQSLHHTAPTLGLRSAEVTALGFIAASFGYRGGAFILGLFFAPRSSPQASGQPHFTPQPPYLTHIRALAALLLLAFVAWLVLLPAGGGSSSVLGLFLVVLGGSALRRSSDSAVRWHLYFVVWVWPGVESAVAFLPEWVWGCFGGLRE